MKNLNFKSLLLVLSVELVFFGVSATLAKAEDLPGSIPTNEEGEYEMPVETPDGAYCNPEAVAMAGEVEAFQGAVSAGEEGIIGDDLLDEIRKVLEEEDGSTSAEVPENTSDPDTDSDGDGYSDDYERLHGSNPNDATSIPDDIIDTDGDGKPDGIDTNNDGDLDDPDDMVFEDEDTDGDGVSNGDESDAGTDPLDPSSFPGSDGNNMPPGEEEPGTFPDFPESDPTGADDVSDERPETIPELDPTNADVDQVDSDGDGISDMLDPFPDDPYNNDRDGDGFPNPVDVDDDGDRWPDVIEGQIGSDPLDPHYPDADSDGFPNEPLPGWPRPADRDDDNDGVPDNEDLDPFDPHVGRISDETSSVETDTDTYTYTSADISTGTVSDVATSTYTDVCTDVSSDVSIS